MTAASGTAITAVSAAAGIQAAGTPRITAELFLSRGALDRAASLRTDDAALARAWADPATRVLPIAAGTAAVTDGPDGTVALVLLAPHELQRETASGARIFLGLDADGIAYFAVGAERLPLRAGTPARAAGLREVGSLLGPRDAGLFVHGAALLNWHATHTHCPRCGAATEPAAGGHVRRCTVDASEHYPRTDPAVIMAVLDGADRILLGHQAAWPPGRFSTLAGFVEPGESLETAVAREVAEEAGVIVEAVDYAGSQPWPFPASLMLGFYARASSTDIVVDGLEIAEARWFTRAELRETTTAGDVLLPPTVSIARRLIEGWYGAELTEPRGW